jgi:hypothetical protein
MTECKLCGETIHFDDKIVSERTGKKIPLDEGSDGRHQCEEWKAQNRRYYNCRNCGQPIYFDENQKSKNDKFIPLDKEAGQPHVCSGEKAEQKGE